MKLFIDESGNTGEVLSSAEMFNFNDQPYYALSGLLLNDEEEQQLTQFVGALINKYKIQGDELKAKNIYKSKVTFFEEIVGYILNKKIAFFIELMDKQFFLNMYLVDYFFLPYYSLPLSDKVIQTKKEIARSLSKHLTQDIYESFTSTVKTYTNSALEKFYNVLENHFKNVEDGIYVKHISKTKEDYLELKEENSQQALEKFLPKPDKNPNNRLIHLLPNYNAFTNLIARAQKYNYSNSGLIDFDIIHDEQKQFDVIYKSALEHMKSVDSDKILSGSSISKKAMFNINKNTKLLFVDSKTDLCVQVSDLISGFVMRYCIDRDKRNMTKIKSVEPIIRKLAYPYAGTSVGINFVVPIP